MQIAVPQIDLSILETLIGILLKPIANDMMVNGFKCASLLRHEAGPPVPSFYQDRGKRRMGKYVLKVNES